MAVVVVVMVMGRGLVGMMGIGTGGEKRRVRIQDWKSGPRKMMGRRKRARKDAGRKRSGAVTTWTQGQGW